MPNNNNYKERLENIKEVNEKNKTERTRLTERTANLKLEEERLLNELKELGLTPDEIESWIEQTESKLNESLSKCEEILGLNKLKPNANNDEELEEEV